ncbi:MAG: penicillin-binding protein activator, partial [Ectothiorhodospira sp.]
MRCIACLLFALLWGLLAGAQAGPPEEPAQPSGTNALAAAQRALERDAPLEALGHLPMEPDRLPPAQRAHILEIRARAEQQLGRILDAVSTWNTLWALDDDPGHRRRTEDAARSALGALPRNILAAVARRADDPATRRWLQWILGERGRPGIQTSYTTRPAPNAPTPGTASRAGSSGPVGDVAVLLPLSGRHQALGQAVREGIEAARADRDRAPRLRFYDTGGSPERAAARYREAIRAGAQGVIGPLLKPCVAAFARQEVLPVPVLALNRAGTAPPFPQGLLQMGLPPEEEAAQVARDAYAAGHRRAFILVPDTPLGRRLETAFSARFRDLGGRIAAVRRHPDGATDFQGAIRQGLGSGRVDVIFLGGDAAAARMIRPQLGYVRKEPPPVLATSRVHPPHADPARDEDLNGIRFTDIPALIRREDRPPVLSGARWPRLTALGMDALDLITRPDFPEALAGSARRGYTGQLRLDPQRRLQRELSWARFTDGRVVAASSPRGR